MLGLLIIFSLWIALTIIIALPLILTLIIGQYIAEKIKLQGTPYYIFIILFYMILLMIMIIL